MQPHRVVSRLVGVDSQGPGLTLSSAGLDGRPLVLMVLDCWVDEGASLNTGLVIARRVESERNTEAEEPQSGPKGARQSCAGWTLLHGTPAAISTRSPGTVQRGTQTRQAGPPLARRPVQLEREHHPADAFRCRKATNPVTM